MKSRRVPTGSMNLRWVLGFLLIAGCIAASVQTTHAQTTGSFASQDYGWSLTWDEASWEQYDSDAELLGLRGISNYANAGFITRPAANLEQSCLGYRPNNASQRTVEITSDYLSVTPPYGSTVMTLLVGPEPGFEESEVHQVICVALDDAGNELEISLVASPEEFDALVPLFDTLISGLVLPESASTQVPAQLATYTATDFPFSLAYDSSHWTSIGDRSDGTTLQGFGTLLDVYGTSSYGGNAADCIADASQIANSEAGAETRELAEAASLVEGLGVEGAQVSIVVNTFDPTNESGAENWIAVACVPMNDASVLVITVPSDETNMANHISAAKDVVDTIKINA